MDAPSDFLRGCAPVLVTEPLWPSCAAWLSARRPVVAAAAGTAAFAAAIGRAEALVVRTYTRVDGALLCRAPRLRVVGRAGVGLDQIDLDACRARGIAVLHTPDANAPAVAELVFASLFRLLRPFCAVAESLSDAAWASLRAGAVSPCMLRGLRLGVVGLGRVGSRVARAGAAFEARVGYHDVREIAPAGRYGAAPMGLEELLGWADAVTVHVDGGAVNRGLFGASAFARMRPGAVFINTSRGFIVDEGAVAGWLAADPEARAVLDVHAQEPFLAGSPLLTNGCYQGRAVLLPHIGAATAPAKEAMGWVVRGVVDVLEGRQPGPSAVRAV